MVAPESVSSTNEDEGNHERRSQAAAAIRRGNIKISKPILEPITWVEGVPDTSSQQHLASNIVPREVEEEGDEREDDQIHGVAVSTNDEHPQEPTGDSSQLHHKASAQFIQEQARLTPTDPRLEQRDSVIEVSPSGQDQMQSKKKRRSGTIRTVLRKVFGRKEKTQSKQLSPPQSRAGPKHEYTLSDPLPSTKNPTNQSHEELRKQNPLRSQPADEYVSHPVMVTPVLPFPMNINAPDPSASPSNYLSFETGPRVHRRRATLPSMILSPDDAAALRKMWSSSDLQPISPSTQSLGQSLPSPEIGMAYTSGSNPNRRSRSAGALRELSRVQAQTTGLRRRSSEIRYWRTSRMDMEQLENERRVSTSSECRSEESSIAPSVHNSMTEMSDAFADTGSSVRGDNVHAFDFGSITTEQNSTDKHVSVVEARLSQLEFNMQHLSMSLQEVTQQNNRHTFVLEKVPSQRKSQSSLNSSWTGLPADAKETPFPKLTTSSKRYTQSTTASTGYPVSQAASTSYLPPSGPYSPMTPTILSPGPAQTIRPSTSQAIPQAQTAILEEVAPSPLNYDHLVPLYNALRYERSVRKGLETQVLQLRRDVLELGKVVTQLRGHEGYPTPSPDQILREEGHQRERSRFSGYDSDDDGKGLAEKWATPREETAPRPRAQVSSEGEMF